MTPTLPGIGHRLDGWPNRDLNVGAIVSSAPDLTAFVDLLQIPDAEVKRAVEAWGPGKFDAELNLDGKAFRPDGKTAATLNPPAFGLAGVNNHTWTGSWGTVTYWNAYVANLEMHGKGVFYDPRLDDAEKYPVAARTGQGHKQDEEDRITAKLPALHLLSALAANPEATGRRLRQRCRRAGRNPVQRQGEMLHLPRPADFHRAGLEPTHRGGDRHRRLPGDAITGRPLRDGAAKGAVEYSRRSTRVGSTTTEGSPRLPTLSTTTTITSASV